MASFPALPLHHGTRLGYQDELVIERASSGTLRARSFWAGKKADKIVLPLRLTRAQTYGASTTTLFGFFDAWKAGTSPFSVPLEPFTVTIDALTYTVVFSAVPTIAREEYGIYDCDVQLAEV